MSWKTMMAGLAAASLSAATFTTALAEDFGPAPANYEDAAKIYVTDRLTHPRSPRFQFTSEPYQVIADIQGYEDLPCWAVDVRVKARLPGDGYGGYIPYTVLFVNGEAVALKQDVKHLSRL